jgi:hypothetical protein
MDKTLALAAVAFALVIGAAPASAASHMRIDSGGGSFGSFSDMPHASGYGGRAVGSGMPMFSAPVRDFGAGRPDIGARTMMAPPFHAAHHHFRRGFSDDYGTFEPDTAPLWCRHVLADPGAYPRSEVGYCRLAVGSNW